MPHARVGKFAGGGDKAMLPNRKFRQFPGQIDEYSMLVTAPLLDSLDDMAIFPRAAVDEKEWGRHGSWTTPSTQIYGHPLLPHQGIPLPYGTVMTAWHLLRRLGQRGQHGGLPGKHLDAAAARRRLCLSESVNAGKFCVLSSILRRKCRHSARSNEHHDAD